MTDRDEPDVTADSRAGVVLAGGFSTRFGDADKAVADLGGKPMVRHVAERVATVTDELVINCRDEQTEPIHEALEPSPVDARFAVDPTPDLGPLGGIRIGLEAVESPYAAIVACDMPFVDPDLLAALFETAEGRDGAVPKLEDGWYQTTQAVYRSEPMVRACTRALEESDGRVLAALEYLDWVVVDEATVREHAPLETFESVDTREELEAAERRLARR
ncbi:molybdenum cofactor guanylyltransferase [Natribaculum luteum]|uniref:Probable molybdenum cofactor guanylyltransferase n=1 Tax=Natribaculum luteum TaxID=1586232 RepID=A0ABD5P4W1_9EURY|nr:molybdenum cofactor guanylyltransferase [Natribaculum luteum]